MGLRSIISNRHQLWRTLSWPVATQPLSHFSSRSKRVIDMAARDGELRVFLVAGEVSGDSIAARLMASLKNLSPFPVRFAGVGGKLMYKEGLQPLFPMEDIAVMGLWELLPHLNNIRIKLKEAIEATLLFRPHAVVTVDSKGFSFRLLKQLKRRYIELEISPMHFHYVAPSFWAWKGGESRLKQLRQFVDHILCVLPFEEEICRQNGLCATYVGHPLLEDAIFLNLELQASSDKHNFQRNGEAFRRTHGLSPGATIITLLPGSRLQEVTLMLPIFLRTVEQLEDLSVELSVVIPVAPNHHVESFIGKAIQSWPRSAVIIPGESLDKKYAAFSASRAALCTSGSAVMELMLAGLPSVVAYRAHFFTEFLIHIRRKINFISLPNILLNSAIIPEVLFNSCTSDNLARELREVLFNNEVRQLQASAKEKVLQILYHPIKKQRNSDLEKFGFSPNIRCPSMVAASTVLYAGKGKD
ncbi:probable lipid-A-disaccharide synthase, mitochondrial isoform X1 [Typha latifolia]|uniref:probable lipid-A-disaccharide synthase, mitochondrial isoform X1 n=3 Tax=Typha latifolia TaxID=4733 RepID=UPI003C2C21C6